MKLADSWAHLGSQQDLAEEADQCHPDYGRHIHTAHQGDDLRGSRADAAEASATAGLARPATDLTAKS